MAEGTPRIEPIFRIEKLRVRFRASDGEVHAVRGVDLEAQDAVAVHPQGVRRLDVSQGEGPADAFRPDRWFA